MYEIYVTTLQGERLSAPLLDLRRCEWSVGLNRVGASYIEVSRADWDTAWFDETLLLDIWREPGGLPPVLVQRFFMRDFGAQQRTARQGDETVAWIRGYDLNHVLLRRIVDGAAGSAAAEKTGAAGEIMPEYITEALLTAGDRDISDELPLTLVYDATDGETITYTASRGALLRVLTGCADSSAQLGTPMRFWLAPQNAGGLLRISSAPWGVDRSERWPFSPETGTLFNASWSHKSGTAPTVGYVGGQGQEEDRDVVTVGEATGLARFEAWYENSQIPLGALDTLRDWGRARLWRNRPRLEFTGELRDTEDSRFGIDWGLGDLVRCEFDGLSVLCEVDAINGAVLEGDDQIVGHLAPLEVV